MDEQRIKMDNVKEQIYNAFNKDIEKFDFENIDSKQKKYNELFPFSPEEKLAQENYFEDWLVRFVFNSNSIEGSTLSLGDTALVCDGEFVPTDKNTKLKDIFAAKGICDGYKFMEEQIKRNCNMDKNLIQNIHEITCLDMDVSVRGLFRNSQVWIKGANTVPVPPEKVRENIEDLLFAYENSKAHPIVKAAAFHCMYERIHPFQDGNGRSGRTLLNFILEKNGYPGITIKYDGKGEYCKALDEWAFNGNNSMFVKLVSCSVESELDTKLSIISQIREHTSEKINKVAQKSTIQRAKSASKVNTKKKKILN